MKSKPFLKEISAFSRLYRLVVSNLRYLLFEKGFHSDKIFQSLVKEIVLSLPITSFIETGTYLGASTKYVASIKPDLPIFSCEIQKKFFIVSKIRLRKFKNIRLYLGSSPIFLQELINSNFLGNLPLFFLDAHWYDYWPLEDEIKIITSSIAKAIIIIDDFEVPGRPEFNFDIYNSKICGFDLIEQTMDKKNSYKALLPFYSDKDAFLEKNSLTLTGYIVIFQNLEKEFELIRERFSDKYFTKAL
jgi:predicted O-methyltransferase YrrM